MSIGVYGRFLRYPLLCDDFYLLGFETKQIFGLPQQWLGEISTFRWIFFALYPFFFRPLPLSVWLADFHLFGDSGAAPHLLNILLLFGGASLMFLFLTRFGLKKLSAFWAAIVIIVNPVSAGTVVWASDSFDLFSFFFIMLALLLYQSFLSQKSMAAYAGACLATIAAPLSKENAVILVVLLPLLDVLFMRTINGGANGSAPLDNGLKNVQSLKERILRLAPFVLIIAAYAAIRYLLLGNLALAGGVLAPSDCVTCRIPHTLLTLIAPLDDQLFRHRYIYAFALIAGSMLAAALVLIIARWKKPSGQIRRATIFLAVFFLFSASALQFFYYFYEIRFLYFSFIVLAGLLVTGLLEFGWPGKKWRITVSILLTMFTLTNLYVIIRNDTVWEQSSRAAEEITSQMRVLLPDPPPDSRIYVGMSKGVRPLVECKPFFSCTVKEAYGRHDLTILEGNGWNNDGYLFFYSAEDGKLSLEKSP